MSAESRRVSARKRYHADPEKFRRYARGWAKNKRAETSKPKPALAERLLSKVHINEANGCWEWTASIDTHGYGHISVNGKLSLAHRAFYEEFVGPIPSGLPLDHLCRTRRCVRPSHLEPVTLQENIRRGEKPNRTHCVNGHEFTESNTYLRSEGGRACRACRNNRGRASYHERRKAA